MAVARRLYWKIPVFVLLFNLGIFKLGVSSYEEEQKVIEVGQPFTLQCNQTTVPATSSPGVNWLKDGEFINETDSRYKMEGANGSFTLTIFSSLDSDAGIYVCVLNVSEPDSNITFQVSSKPRFLDHTLGKSINQVEGDTLMINCKVAGNPRPTLTWLKDNMTVENDSRIDLLLTDDDFTLKLVIRELEYGDRANYTCVARSAGGTVSASTTVRVKDKLAALWPFLGIVAEVGVLCTIIFIYEKRRAKQEFEESDTDQSPDTKNVPDNKEKDVRQRK